MYCNISKKYSSNNTKLSQTIEKSKVQCLKTDELNKLQSQFDKELAKQQQD